jgi:hypothetical protein
VARAVGASATWGHYVGIAQGLRDGRQRCRHVCLAPHTDSPFKVHPRGNWVVTTNFGDLFYEASGSATDWLNARKRAGGAGLFLWSANPGGGLIRGT